MARRVRSAVLMAAVAVLAGCADATTSGHPVGTHPPSTSGLSGAPATSATTVRGATFTDPALVRTVLADATHDVVVTNTYDYRRLDAFLAGGSAVATGTFLTQFRMTVNGVLKKDAPAVHQVQAATVSTAGIGSLTSGSEATALVFGHIQITNTSSRSARLDPFRAVVHLRAVGGSWLINQIDVGASSSSGMGSVQLRADPPGTAGLKAATAAAARGAADLATYSRAHFARDFARALAQTTGGLRSQVQQTRATTLRTLVSGRFDIEATTTAAAVQTASGRSAVVLVALDGRQSAHPDAPNLQSLSVTVVDVRGTWLMSEISAVALK